MQLLSALFPRRHPSAVVTPQGLMRQHSAAAQSTKTLCVIVGELCWHFPPRKTKRLATHPVDNSTNPFKPNRQRQSPSPSQNPILPHPKNQTAGRRRSLPPKLSQKRQEERLQRQCYPLLLKNMPLQPPQLLQLPNRCQFPVLNTKQLPQPLLQSHPLPNLHQPVLTRRCG